MTSSSSSLSLALFQFSQLYRKTCSQSSQPSSLLSCRLGSTEDLYCDDELHPSLEHDPNMRLMDEHLLDRFHTERFSSERYSAERDDGEDDVIILSVI